MKIKVSPKELYKVVNCLEARCLYRKKCANHTSAGDFRSEDGFRPKLYLIEDDVYCDSIEEPPLESEFEFLPRNINSLDCGEVLWTQLTEKI